VMTENYRTGLIWKMFMSNPEIQPMLEKIGFQKDAASAGAPKGEKAAKVQSGTAATPQN